MITIMQTGRVAYEPELKESEGGTKFCRITLISNRKFKGKESSTGLRWTIFGKAAEIVGEYAKKGEWLSLSGRLDERKWEEEGKAMKSYDAVANEFSFVSVPVRSAKSETPREPAPDYEDLPF